jgi:hypothetical protein
VIAEPAGRHASQTPAIARIDGDAGPFPCSRKSPDATASAGHPSARPGPPRTGLRVSPREAASNAIPKRPALFSLSFKAPECLPGTLRDLIPRR